MIFEDLPLSREAKFRPQHKFAVSPTKDFILLSVIYGRSSGGRFEYVNGSERAPIKKPAMVPIPCFGLSLGFKHMLFNPAVVYFGFHDVLAVTEV